MLQSLDKILFFDIETAPSVAEFGLLNEEMQHLWTEKYGKLADRNPERYAQTAEKGWQEAGVYAEFARVVCMYSVFRHLRTILTAAKLRECSTKKKTSDGYRYIVRRT